MKNVRGSKKKAFLKDPRWRKECKQIRGEFLFLKNSVFNSILSKF